MTTPCDVLVVDVDGSPYAFLVSDVAEVLPAAVPVAVPGAPSVVEGLLDLRGRLVPLLSLRRRLGLKDRPLHPDDDVVVCTTGGDLVAVRVDHALDVVRLEGSVEALEPEPPHLCGVARTQQGPLLVQDVAAFLSGGEAARLADAVARSPVQP